MKKYNEESYNEGLCANCEKLGVCEFARTGKLFCDNFVKSDDDI